MEKVVVPVLIFYGAVPENLLAHPMLKIGPYSNGGQGYTVSEAKENFEGILYLSLSSYLEQLSEVGKTFADLPQKYLPDSSYDNAGRLSEYFSKKVPLDDQVIKDSTVQLPAKDGLPALTLSFYRLASIPE